MDTSVTTSSFVSFVSLDHIQDEDILLPVFYIKKTFSQFVWRFYLKSLVDLVPTNLLELCVIQLTL